MEFEDKLMQRLNVQVGVDTRDSFRRVVRLRMGSPRNHEGTVVERLMDAYVSEFNKTFLFCIPIALEKDLRTGAVSPDIRRYFERNGYVLPINASFWRDTETVRENGENVKKTLWMIKTEKGDYKFEIGIKSILIHKLEDRRRFSDD